MVRKRGVARRSFAHRRVRRIEKYDHHVIPRRFKLQLPEFANRLEDPLWIYVMCEEPTMVLLKDLGVPTSQWQYYIGFMKRMVELYLNFTEETLAKEKESLITEYVLRGKDITVLEQVQEVAANCAEGIFELPFTCDDVKACLEGNYAAWTFRWNNSIPNGLGLIAYFGIHFIEKVGYFAMSWRDSGGDFRFGIYKLSDMSAIFQSGAGSDYTYRPVYQEYHEWFGRGGLVYAAGGGIATSYDRYLALLRDDQFTIEIWKDGVLTQTINIQDYEAGDFVHYIGFSLNGKYLIVLTEVGNKLLLFEGA